MTMMQFHSKPSLEYPMDPAYEAHVIREFLIRYCWHTPAPCPTTCYAFVNEYGETHVAFVKDGSPTAAEWQAAARR